MGEEGGWRGLNHLLHLNQIELCTRGQNLESVLDLNFSLTIQTLTTDEKCILTFYHIFYQSYQENHQRIAKGLVQLGSRLYSGWGFLPSQ